MPGDANHGNMQTRSVSSSTMDQDEVGNKANRTCLRSTDLIAHNYMGLSTSSCVMSACATQVQANCSSETPPTLDTHTNIVELEDSDTELRLGIGPVQKGDVNLSVTDRASPANKGMMLEQQAVANRQLVKQGEFGLGVWSGPHADFTVCSPLKSHQSFWPWMMPGRFLLPLPKVNAVPAKRPYTEIVGESGDNKASTDTNATNLSTPSEAALHLTDVTQLPIISSSSHSGLYTLGHNSNPASSAQHATCPDSAIVSLYANNMAFMNRSWPRPPVFKQPPAPPASQNGPLPPSTPSSVEAMHQESAKTCKPPVVVGWPPVRAFRKNTLHSAAGVGVKESGSTSSGLPKHGDSVTNSPKLVGAEQNGISNKDALFVKVKLDGVRICRKVDVTAYDNYDSLKSALQEMFEGFICSDNAQLDLLQGRNYVLTHEDKDGDWMLVGDVPWRMFVTTVKSFRIMKAADAVGLGGKVFAKWKAADIA